MRSVLSKLRQATMHHNDGDGHQVRSAARRCMRSLRWARLWWTGWLSVCAVGTILAQSKMGVPELVPVIRLHHETSYGVATTADGKRIFITIDTEKGAEGPQIAEWVNDRVVPYPDAAWNSGKPAEDGNHVFQHAHALRLGPDGSLWIVDSGSRESDKLNGSHGPKLVQIDVNTNKVLRTYDMSGATKPNSLLDDIRFNGPNAYMTDAGVPALIVMDVKTGKARRVMEGQMSVTAQKPISAEGRTLILNGKPLYIHADQLEVSPDGKYLYYQPCSGPLWRVETRLLDDMSVSDQERTQGAKLFAETTTTGGTAIDAQGNIYASDTNKLAILKITPKGQVSTLVQDPRLVWVDAMWIDSQGYLWLPAAQMNLLPQFNDGVSKTTDPRVVYKVKIGIGPPANDHP